jgi:hypothetical protein
MKFDDFNLFSIYNQNTKLNDYFNLSKDSIYFVKSINLNANLYTKKDSFNPSGTSNLGAGIIMGSINMLFKNLFN